MKALESVSMITWGILALPYCLDLHLDLYLTLHFLL
jgi:hypothetical protein